MAPDFALAWTGLARALYWQWVFTLPEDAAPEIQTALERANGSHRRGADAALPRPTP
jgi:hypothetical protein